MRIADYFINIDTPARPFLDAIKAEPKENLTRLVFADWLDEQGHGDYAKFIRLQIEQTRTPFMSAKWLETRKTLNNLFDPNWFPLVTPVRPIPQYQPYWNVLAGVERGFPYKLKSNVQTWTIYRSILPMYPIIKWKLSDLSPRIVLSQRVFGRSPAEREQISQSTLDPHTLENLYVWSVRNSRMVSRQRVPDTHEYFYVWSIRSTGCHNIPEDIFKNMTGYYSKSETSLYYEKENKAFEALNRAAAIL